MLALLDLGSKDFNLSFDLDFEELDYYDLSLFNDFYEFLCVTKFLRGVI